MTTRVLDVQAGILIGVERPPASPYADVTWMSVLRSLSGGTDVPTQRRRGRVGPDALRFLLQDPQFPRSVEHCLTAVARSLLELPRCQDDGRVGRCRRVLEATDAIKPWRPASCTSRWTDVQELIGRLHERVADTYFRIAPAAPGVLLSTG